MSNVKFSKVVNSLPSVLDKDTIYLVKKGDKVHSFVTNSVGETVPFILSTTADSIGLGNVDNTSDLDKPVSNATQEELDNRYTKNTADELFAPINVQRSNLPGRLRYCSYFTGIFPGDYVDNGSGSYISEEGSIPPNTLVAFPFIAEHGVTVDQVGLNITSARNNEFFSIGLYDSDPNTRAPHNLIQQTNSIDSSPVGYQNEILNPMLTVEGGKLYYIALAISRAGVQYSTIPPANCFSIGGVADPESNQYYNSISVPFDYETSMPSIWPSYSPAQRSSFTVPSVRLRVHSSNVSFM